MVEGACATPTGQPWSDERPVYGRILVVTDNPIARALLDLAAVVGHRASLLFERRLLMIFVRLGCPLQTR